jgi:hypothetical protein
MKQPKEIPLGVAANTQSGLEIAKKGDETLL